MKTWAWLLVFWFAWWHGTNAVEPALQLDEPREQFNETARQGATIHWQRLPLRDAVLRLEQVFGVAIFVDRRVNPSQRLSLDIQSSSVENVLESIAAPRELGVSRLGRLLYLGPRVAAEQLRPLAAFRAEEVGKLPADLRSPLARGRAVRWPRRSQPRELVSSLVRQAGWRVVEAERIPHDLWPAGELPDLPLVEQLTVLLLGFDLSFEIRPPDRTLQIVPLDRVWLERLVEDAKQASAGESGRKRTGRTPTAVESRQVYTLRVAEQPVGTVIQELARRLNWQIEIDEAAIRAAGRSVEQRVSFSVENAEQEELLEALLRPAGLGYRRQGEQIKVVPRESN